MKLSTFLQRELARRGWEQKELSHQSGIPQSTISRLVKGQTLTPDPPTIQRLASALDIPFARLMTIAGYAMGEPQTDAELMRDLALLTEHDPTLMPDARDLASLSQENRRIVTGLVKQMLAEQAKRG